LAIIHVDMTAATEDPAVIALTGFVRTAYPVLSHRSTRAPPERARRRCDAPRP